MLVDKYSYIINLNIADSGTGWAAAHGRRALRRAARRTQYLSVAPGEDLLAIGRCTRRGRTVHFAQAQACGAASGQVVATGQVAVSISGERPGAPWQADE